MLLYSRVHHATADLAATCLDDSTKRIRNRRLAIQKSMPQCRNQTFKQKSVDGYCYSSESTVRTSAVDQTCLSSSSTLRFKISRQIFFRRGRSVISRSHKFFSSNLQHQRELKGAHFVDPELWMLSPNQPWAFQNWALRLLWARAWSVII